MKNWWYKENYLLSKEFSLLLLDTLIDLGENKAKTKDEKAFVLDLMEYIFYVLKEGE